MSRSDRAERILPGLLRNLADELDRDPELMKRVFPFKREGARQGMTERAVIDFDVFEVLKEGGESDLRKRLELLDVAHLKAIVAQHGLDTTRLAQKWRNKQRLVSFIVDRINARAQKGEVFMSS